MRKLSRVIMGPYSISKTVQKTLTWKHDHQYASSKYLQGSAVLLCRSSYLLPSVFKYWLNQVFILAIAEEALIGENEGECIAIDGVCTDIIVTGPQPWVNFTLFAVLPTVNNLLTAPGTLWVCHLAWIIRCWKDGESLYHCGWWNSLRFATNE